MSKGGTLVYAILTIPEDPRNMTANLKAPIVVNTKDGSGRQVVLQENEYSIKCAMYKELLALILSASKKPGAPPTKEELSATALRLSTAESQVQVSPL